MRCSLKDGFVILLILFFTPLEGKGDPLFLYKNSIADRSINFDDFSTMSRVEQSFDSFPKLGEYDKRSHKIVKKQMTASDYKHAQKNKRSVFSLQEISNYEDDVKCGYTEKIEQAIPESASYNNYETKKSTFPVLRKQTDLEKDLKKKIIKNNALFRRGIFSKKQKSKKINDNETQQTQEKFFEAAINKLKEATTKKTESETEKASAKTGIVKEDKKANEKDAVKGAGSTLVTEHKKPLKNLKAIVKGNENLKDTKLIEKLKNAAFKQGDIQEEYKTLKNMIGCKVENYCRFPDVQDNHDYFECEADESGCIKLTHKKCPEGEIFSSRFLECLNPFFWKLVEREKRSLWQKGKKQYPYTWGEGQPSTTWTDATHEEGKQFLSELRPKNKPKLVVYHLKVKKAINEDLQKGKKEQRHIPGVPRLTHSEIRRRFTQKAANIKSRDHQLFPRSFIIRINKKDGKNDHEESVSENENDDSEDSSDDEEDDEEDDDINEDASDEEEDTEEEGEHRKTAEKGGIREFFKSAKEAITNRARFNEPADTSFTLDKTNSYSKNKKLDGSEKDSRKILIDADIKVDKTLGKTLKRILGKRKDKDDGNVSLNESLLSDRGSQDQMESEQTIMYENLIRSNPRLKRYFLVSLGEREN